MHLVPAPAVRLMKEPLVSDAGTKRTKERKVRTRRLEEMMRAVRLSSSLSLVNRLVGPVHRLMSHFSHERGDVPKDERFTGIFSRRSRIKTTTAISRRFQRLDVRALFIKKD